MHTVDDITEIFHAPTSSIPGCSNDYLGVYNKLLSGLFEESCFLVTFPKQNCIIYNRPIRDPKAVLLLLALDEEPNSDESVEEDMQKLLMEAKALEIKTIHGLCVWETKVAFYHYDREQGVVLPNRGHVHFDLDLKKEDGAAGVIEVAEDVKRMCKSVGMRLKL